MTKYYVYVSRTKISMLSDQQDSDSETVTTTLGMNLKLLSAVRRTQKHNLPTVHERLSKVTDKLRAGEWVGAEGDEASYIYAASLPMTWGVMVVPKDPCRAAVFCSRTQRSLLLLVGDAQNIIGKSHRSEGRALHELATSPSQTPGFVDLLLRSLEGVHDTEAPPQWRHGSNRRFGVASQVMELWKRDLMPMPLARFEFFAKRLFSATTDDGLVRVTVGSPIYVADAN